jgi:hypothetical protein
MKTLEEVLTFAREDEDFANDLKTAAKDAVLHGIGTQKWRELMDYFAQSPEELNELSDPEGIADESLQCRAFMTALAYTSDICPTTIFGFDVEAAAKSRVVMGSRRAKAVTKKKPQAKSTTPSRASKKSVKTKRSSKKSTKTKRS